MDSDTYKKRVGASGAQGQLYESKFISLINFRMIHDDNVEQFSLATNRDDVGAFDDICFKAKIKGIEKPVAVFIQAKHRENDKVLTFTSESDLTKYFDSYLEIRRAFEPSSKDKIFRGKFEDTECFFVMYTPAKNDPSNKIYEGSIAEYLNKLIGTNGCCTQPLYTDETLNLLCKIVMKDQITKLAKQLAKFVCDKSNGVMSMNNDLILRYHVILAHKVVHVSEIQSEDYRIASFRQDFFTTNDEFLVLFRNILCSEILEIRKSEEIDVQMYLLSLKLKVPTSFGNKDLAIRGSSVKVKKRLDHLTSTTIKLLEKSNTNNIVTIDEYLATGFLQLNGGIASAVGNILVFDESSKLLKFTENCEALGTVAKTWYETLKSKIQNLHEYKFDVKVKNFPKLSFERGEYDLSLVRDFYDKLLFYTNQSDQNGVEVILREEIANHLNNDVNGIRSEAIFLKYHAEIQKLWMKSKVGTYLKKKSKIYENAETNTMNESLMGVLNVLHEIKNKHYTFNENALKLFESHGQIVGTVIATQSCETTVAKVEQYLGNKDRLVLDLKIILKLPWKEHDTLCEELTTTDKEKILIIVCYIFKDSEESGRRLKNIAQAVLGKQIIIITNMISVDIISQYFSQASNVLKDLKRDFTDLSVESQNEFLAATESRVQTYKELLLDPSMHDVVEKIRKSYTEDNDSLVSDIRYRLRHSDWTASARACIDAAKPIIQHLPIATSIVKRLFNKKE